MFSLLLHTILFPKMILNRGNRLLYETFESQSGDNFSIVYYEMLIGKPKIFSMPIIKFWSSVGIRNWLYMTVTSFSDKLIFLQPCVVCHFILFQMKARERRPLEELCDHYLREQVGLLGTRHLIAIGSYSFNRAKAALKNNPSCQVKNNPSCYVKK